MLTIAFNPFTSLHVPALPRPPPFSPMLPFKVDDGDVFNETNRLLNHNSYRITDIEAGNDPGITQNVRLLLNSRNVSKGGVGQQPWSTTCCLTGVNRGTFVNPNATTTVRPHKNKKK